MSRDSRLLHSHLHALAAHLREHNLRLAAAAEVAHAQLDEKRAAPARDTHQPAAVELPEHKPPPRQIEHAPVGD